MTKNVAASVRARLQNRAKADNRPFQEVLQYYGLERFLYRFSRSQYRDRFVLKGALMLRVWQAPESRPTRDIDFLGFVPNEIGELESIVREVCASEVEDDGLRFDASTVTGVRIKEDADYEGVRIIFTGFLDNARIPMQLDIGFGDVVHPSPTERDYPTILKFPAPRLRVYPFVLPSKGMGPRDDVYWAEFLGIQSADWFSSGISFRSHVGLRDYRGLWCFRRRELLVVSAPPVWIETLEGLWADWDPKQLMDAGVVKGSLGQDCESCVGPVFHGCLDPASLHDFVSSRVRPVAITDHDAIERFRVRCGADAWNVSGLHGIGGIAHVYPSGKEITAMAGLREKSDEVGDLCVLTDPRSRREGRGKAVVGAVIRDALARGRLVQYQTLEANHAAVRLARSLGFARYANHLAVRLKNETPRTNGTPVCGRTH